MGLRINQNIDAFNAYRNLSVTQGQASKSLEKLSSGFRINRAADDAAGLAISEGLRSQVGGLKVGVRNAQDGISVVQTAEGALTEVHSMLQRMNDLSVQYANGTQNTDSQAALSAEFDQLQEEIVRITDNTKFNGVALFNDADLAFQVGSDAADVITVTGADALAAVDTSGRRHHRQHHGPDRDHRDLDPACLARCVPEPVRAHDQLGERGDREPVRLREPDPRHRHGVRDGAVHPLEHPVAGRHRHARSGEPGAPGRPLPAPLITT